MITVRLDEQGRAVACEGIPTGEMVRVEYRGQRLDESAEFHGPPDIPQMATKGLEAFWAAVAAMPGTAMWHEHALGDSEGLNLHVAAERAIRARLRVELKS